VSLHTWFAARERPAVIERALFDRLQAAAGSAQAQLTAAVEEAGRHALALDEMTAAEKAHGFISRSQDADPWLANVRAAVAREAASYGAAYPEGEGAGLRYTAFQRHAALARRSLERLREAQASLSALRARLRPQAASGTSCASSTPRGSGSPGPRCATRSTARSRSRSRPRTRRSWTGRPRARRSC
jgi:hypothetical protein